MLKYDEVPYQFGSDEVRAECNGDAQDDEESVGSVAWFESLTKDEEAAYYGG